VTDVLSDLLQHSLRMVLCGTAAGTTSAAERAYYAHRQNKFWKILHETRLTPDRLPELGERVRKAAEAITRRIGGNILNA